MDRGAKRGMADFGFNVAQCSCVGKGVLCYFSRFSKVQPVVREDLRCMAFSRACH